MFDRTYRQRLETDLARWESDGVVTPAAASAIRAALPPLAPGVTVAMVIAIVGSLLIAAAFLAFVAAHWTELARLLRFVMLLAGILVAHGLGAWFGRDGRPVFADLCAAVGAIIFGAAIALIGQMYHLGGDFAGGMLLWAIGAFASAVLTGSRGALAVALSGACIWTCARSLETGDVPHFQFAVVWLIAGGLALAWNSRVAAHLVAAAAFPWWIATVLQLNLQSAFVLADGAALLFGTGVAFSVSRWPRASSAGAVLAAYGAFALAAAAVIEVATGNESFFFGTGNAHPLWAIACGLAGAVFAFVAAATSRRAGPAFAGGAIALILLAGSVWPPPDTGEPWLSYALELCAMLCLVVSGMLDAARPRIVAGWLGIAGVIAGITWAVKGSLLRRSVFLAVAGGAAVVLSTVLGRLLPRSRA